jgi:hypothetical protein
MKSSLFLKVKPDKAVACAANFLSEYIHHILIRNVVYV